MGMAVSKLPKITPTRGRVRASIPLTPMPIAAAKLDSPRETATSAKASKGNGTDHRPARYGAIALGPGG
jgi:hypothetical protein